MMQICEAFGANRYPFPEEPARQRQMNAEVTARLRELHTTIEAGQLPGPWHFAVVCVLCPRCNLTPWVSVQKLCWLSCCP